jgi:hypothetical protein
VICWLSKIQGALVKIKKFSSKKIRHVISSCGSAKSLNYRLNLSNVKSNGVRLGESNGNAECSPKIAIRWP